MREVKFRAWDKENQIWTNWKSYDGMFYFMVKHTGVWMRDDEFKRFSLMQYTGLKDKNGVEIYEGDIILAYKDYKYVVKFSTDRGGWFPFATDDGCGCCAEEVANNESAEVIGNIYENEKLLKEGEDER